MGLILCPINVCLGKDLMLTGITEFALSYKQACVNGHFAWLSLLQDLHLQLPYMLIRIKRDWFAVRNKLKAMVFNILAS